MARCPNCGRETRRTIDWCCQWCGYPLFSGSYKKIDKTYKELKDERTATVSNDDEPIVADEAIEETIIEDDYEEEVEEEEPEVEVQPAKKPAPVKKVRPKEEPEPAPRKRRRIVKRRRPEPEPEPEPEIEEDEYEEEIEEEVEEEYEDEGYEEEVEEEYEDEDYEEEVEEEYEDEEYEEEVEEEYEDEEYEEEVEEPEEEKPVKKPKQVKKSRPEPEVKPVPRNRRRIVKRRRPAPEPEPEIEEDEYEEEEEEGEEVALVNIEETAEDTVVIEQPTMEITVGDIISAYETEGPEADVKFSNKILRVTGVISRIDVKEAQALFSLTLEAENSSPLRQSMRCIFSREHGNELQQLVKSQTVTVQGKYDGSIINISMRDCYLVQ